MNTEYVQSESSTWVGKKRDIISGAPILPFQSDEHGDITACIQNDDCAHLSNKKPESEQQQVSF